MRFIFVALLVLSLYTPTVRVTKASNMNASYYADKFDGRMTANGTVFRQNDFTAAHLTLPFGTRLLVTNPRNKLSVIVVVTDRGPYSRKFQLDLSRAAAEALGITRANGWSKVEVRKVILDGDDIPSGTDGGLHRQ